jgi:transposase-like protein
VSSAIPFAPHFHEERAAYAFVEAQLWPDGPVCPHCGSIGRSGKLSGKSTRPGLYKCYLCRKPFTIKLGTLFESSNVKLHIWLRAIYLLCGSKHRLSGRLHESLGVTVKTAWSVRHRIREGAKQGTIPAKLIAVFANNRPTVPHGANKRKIATLAVRSWSTPWNMAAAQERFTPLPANAPLRNATGWLTRGVGAFE